MTGVGDVRSAFNKLRPIDHAVFINYHVHANKLHRFILPGGIYNELQFSH